MEKKLISILANVIYFNFETGNSFKNDIILSESDS